MIRDIVDVQITKDTAIASKAGFGVPLIVGIHSKFEERIRIYTSITGVLEDFSTSDPEYKKSAAIFSQEVIPKEIKIGRREANEKQDNNVAVTTVIDDTDYIVTIDGVPYTFDSGSSATASSIVDGLVAVIEAGNLAITLTDNGDDFDIESDISGIGFGITVTDELTLTETTANKSIATELQLIINADNDFYFIISTSKDKQDILQLSAFVETLVKLSFSISNDDSIKNYKKDTIQDVQVLTVSDVFITGNVISTKINNISIAPVNFITDHAITLAALATEIQSNSDIITATVTDTDEITVTGLTIGANVEFTRLTVSGGATQAVITIVRTKDANDVLTQLQALNYSRTPSVQTDNIDNETEAAWVGLNAPEDPGSITWMFKNLAGITPDNYTETEKSTIRGKGGNTYTTVGGVDITETGIVVNGDFIDIIRGTDWIQARVSEAVYQTLVSNKKIPFTSAGMQIPVNAVKTVLALAVTIGILTDDSEPVVTFPNIEDIPIADKAERVLRDINFSAVFAGAIHKIEIRGKISI